MTKTFQTSDISLTAALLATGKVKLLGYQNFQYELEPFEICHQLEIDFINDKLFVSARRIKENIPMLKNLRGEKKYG